MLRNENILLGIRDNPARWLVTGAAGFIGSNLIEALLKADQYVVAVDNFSTGKLENIAAVRAGLTSLQCERFVFVEGDVRDYDLCNDLTKDIDYVLHQAALGSVPRSIDDPLVTNANNVNGFLNVIYAACKNGVRRTVYAASSSTYGDHPALPKVEDVIGRPLSPYAVTKYVNELYAEVFSRVYKFDAVGLRYFNVFGKRQDPSGAYAAVIPKWVGSMLKGERAFLNGDGSTSRDFCYVDNVVQANILAALSFIPDGCSRIFNVAYGQRTSLRELFELLRDGVQALKPSLQVLDPIERDFRAGDVRHSLADISKAAEVLGYSPLYDVRKGIDLMLPWYCQQYD